MDALSTKNKQGFTIIEVVLVLAIAALIFLMVFIALPALQRNQRDTARKTVAGKVASSVTTYQSSNRGNNPTPATYVSKLAGYIDGTAATSTSPGIPTTGILVDNEYYVTLINYAADVNAYEFDTNRRIGDTAAATDASIDAQVVQIVVGAKCDNTGTKAIAANRRNAAILIGLENGNASLCQSV